MLKTLPIHRPAVLCITQEQVSAHAVAADLCSSDWRVITTDDAGESIALLYVSRDVRAVLLDQRGKKTPHLALARIVKALRADVRVFLMFSQPIDPLPLCIDGCLHVDDGVRAIEDALHAIMGAATVAA